MYAEDVGFFNSAWKFLYAVSKVGTQYIGIITILFLQIYWLGPTLGAVFASVFYRYILEPPIQ